MAMAGHCQVNIGNNSILIYGGLTNLEFNTSMSHNGYPVMNYDNSAWTWNSKYGYWSKIITESPCPSSKLPPVIMQQCASKGPFEVVILHQDFESFTTCTSLINVKTLKWTKISSSKSNDLPVGGFILTGIDPMRTFYLGGYTNLISSHNRSIYELKSDWEVMNVKLNFSITGWDSMVLDSRLNLTKCLNDI